MSEPTIFKLRKPLSSSHRSGRSTNAEEEDIYAFFDRSNNWSNDEIQPLMDAELISEHFEPIGVDMVQVLVQLANLKRKRVGDDNGDESNTEPFRDFSVPSYTGGHHSSSVYEKVFMPIASVSLPPAPGDSTLQIK
ncbi:hypothetical protein EW145_g5824 [Phellinidium pouzarii]|uniref:Uncharacterized protein n=1 Tax=Phellinidium pouzarii TaxID=167371 RepID=A0A4S4KZY7_9AGAM|nr:hypothetical protein EW145_g5824 [Phellinidium pouzarii]